MGVSQINRLRFRATRLSREFKGMFLGPDGTPHVPGEHALADLRDFAMVGQPIFSTDPLIMARRLGRREVVERIFNYLNLDEGIVQKLMELDDGLE
jgi:hypothetical protein